MSGFHSMVSRRDYMKILGFGAAGIGAAGLVAPVYHDLDELTSASSSIVNHPWYAKEVDVPTMEIDWDIMVRHNYQLTMNSSPQIWVPNIAQLKANGAKNKTDWMLAGKPGFSLRDWAYNDNSPSAQVTKWAGSPWVGTENGNAPYGPATTNKVATPASLGVPKWQGTPEEASRMVRSFIKAVGTPIIGFLDMGTSHSAKIRKLIYTEFNLADVPVGYRNADGIKVVPNVPLWGIGTGNPMPISGMPTGPGGTMMGGKVRAEAAVNDQGFATQRFITQIGYNCYWGSFLETLPNPAAMTMSGTGEVARCMGKLINPDFGIGMLTSFAMTDLPLATNPPIDAGILRFCADCARCADNCASGAITTDRETSWEVMGSYNCPGHKQYRNENPKCYELRIQLGVCVICQSSCVFEKDNYASVHQFVKALSSKTPMFNSFFRKMDQAFAYGPGDFGPNNNPIANGHFNEKATTWWDKELPSYGADGNLPY